MERNFHKQPESAVPETFVHLFRRNGYYTVGIGKISHTPDGRIRKDKKTLELPYTWDEMVSEKGVWGGGFDTFFAYANGESRASMNHQVEPFECADIEDEGYPDGLNARLAVRKLQELSEKDQPFLLAVGFYKPHLPFNSPKKYWDLYNRNEIQLSPNPDAPDETVHRFVHASGEFFNNYKKHKDRGSAGKRISDDYARLIRHAYFAAVSYVDAQIGKVIKRLKDLGLNENTIVVVWGDHGWHLGDHTIWGKHSPFERSAHSPLIIRTPRMKHTGLNNSGLVETIDLYPTLCDLTEIEPPPGLDGKSMTTMLSDPDAPGKSAVYTYQRDRISMRTANYRMIVHTVQNRSIIALFDHQSDPLETKNIAFEKPQIVNRLLPLLQEGNAGFIQVPAQWEPDLDIPRSF